MNDLLLLLKDVEELDRVQGDTLDCRNWLDDMVTVTFIGMQLDRHARWSMDYLYVIADHRDQLWGTIYSKPATEMQDGQNRWSFTRMVDGNEYVVFGPVESYEVTETWFRYKPNQV